MEIWVFSENVKIFIFIKNSDPNGGKNNNHFRIIQGFYYIKDLL